MVRGREHETTWCKVCKVFCRLIGRKLRSLANGHVLRYEIGRVEHIWEGTIHLDVSNHGIGGGLDDGRDLLAVET